MEVGKKQFSDKKMVCLWKKKSFILFKKEEVVLVLDN